MWSDQHCTHLNCYSNQSIFSINLKSQLSKSHQRWSLPINDHQLPTDFKLEFFTRSSNLMLIFSWPLPDISSKCLIRFVQQISYQIFSANIWCGPPVFDVSLWAWLNRICHIVYPMSTLVQWTNHTWYKYILLSSSKIPKQYWISKEVLLPPTLLRFGNSTH